MVLKLLSNVKTKRINVPKMFGLLRIYELYGSNSFIEIMSELGNLIHDYIRVSYFITIDSISLIFDNLNESQKAN